MKSQIIDPFIFLQVKLKIIAICSVVYQSKGFLKQS